MLLPDFRIAGSNGLWMVTFIGHFSKQKIKNTGIQYRYCVVKNSDLSKAEEEYVYNALKEVSDLRHLKQNNIPGNS